MRSTTNSFVAFIRRSCAALLGLALAMGTVLATTDVAAAAPADERLSLGQRMNPGDHLYGADRTTRLAMQNDGNLVFYGGRANKVIWQTKTGGNPGASLIMQNDGNLVLYSSANKALWQTQTYGKGSAYLQVQADGNLAIRTAAGTAVWQTGTQFYASELAAGNRLSAGRELRSPDGKIRLVMQTDGNLVLYTPGNVARWSTITGGNSGASALMQTDGNWVIYSSAGKALWSTQTENKPVAKAILRNDGAFMLVSSAGAALWDSGTRYYESRLTAPGTLKSGQQLQSGNGAYRLAMQTDGNLVLYGPTGAMWQTRTGGNSGAEAIMQSDGNLVVYSAAKKALWHSGTGGKSVAYLLVQSDGNVVLYTAAGKAVWQTGTYPGYNPSPSPAIGERVVAWAAQQIGKPYVFGAVGPNSFDCSGLTQQAWRSVGVGIERESKVQYATLPKVPYAQAKPGDIIAWGSNPSSAASVYHVAIYIGNGQMIESPSAGQYVRQTPVRASSRMPYVLRPAG